MIEPQEAPDVIRVEHIVKNYGAVKALRGQCDAPGQGRRQPLGTGAHLLDPARRVRRAGRAPRRPVPPTLPYIHKKQGAAMSYRIAFAGILALALAGCNKGPDAAKTAAAAAPAPLILAAEDLHTVARRKLALHRL